MTDELKPLCENFIADPCGSAKCAGCGKYRNQHQGHPRFEPARFAIRGDGTYLSSKGQWIDVRDHEFVVAALQARPAPAGVKREPVAWLDELIADFEAALSGHPPAWAEQSDWGVIRDHLVEMRSRRHADALYTADALPTALVEDEVAWLAEGQGIDGPEYACLTEDMDDHFTSDHSKALRFARREDAEAFINYYGWTAVKAVEHMWLGERSAALASLPGETK